MADWASTSPDNSTPYATVLALLRGRDEDAAKMAESPTNPISGHLRLNRTSKVFEEWTGSWNAILLSVAGGGTGASTASGARTNLGLGTISTQNANSVSITGGSISGTTITGASLDASSITSGELARARGGTGVSLSDGTNGQFLQWLGGTVAWGVSGGSLTGLNASNISSGTVSTARLGSGTADSTTFLRGDSTWASLPAGVGPGGTDTQVQFNDGGSSFGGDAGLVFNKTTNLLTAGSFSGNGASITALNASSLSTGTVPTARLGSGTANSTTFLRGDQTWAVPSTAVPTGLIAIFDTACPSGWTRVSAFDSKFLRGAASYGATGGSSTHSHTINSNGAHTHDVTGTSGSQSVSHTHTFNVTSGTPSSTQTADSGVAGPFAHQTHTHNVSGTTAGPTSTAHDHGAGTYATDSQGSHNHSESSESHIPPYIEVVFCKKS